MITPREAYDLDRYLTRIPDDDPDEVDPLDDGDTSYDRAQDDILFPE